MSRKLGNDKKLCTYGDFTIFESDFRSICSSWLTDTAVNFAATYIKDELFGKSDEKICLVYAFLCEMVKYTDAQSRDEIRELLKSVGVRSDKWCCFLLNDCNDPSAVSGGSHWTLLLHDPVQKVLWQLDPMVDTQPTHCVQLLGVEYYVEYWAFCWILGVLWQHWRRTFMFQFYERIRPFLNDEYRVMPCPKMFLNGSCGIYIVEYLHAIFSYIKNGGRRVHEADLTRIDDRYATERRIFYCDLIQRFAVEQGKTPVSF